MHLQRQALGSRAIFLMSLLIVVAAWASLAGAQASGTNSASIAKPALPADSTDTASNSTGTKPAPASLPDTSHPAVAPNSDTYVIGLEDVLAINVWKEPELSRVVPVRPDGMISLPLLGEIKAQGLTPIELRDQISTPLKKYISDPEVTVIVNEVRSRTFNIVGQVMKPGYYPLTQKMTILDALAMAGGMRDFAKQKKIYVLRTSADGKQVRIPFNYKQVIKGHNASQNIDLEPRDTLVVP